MRCQVISFVQASYLHLWEQCRSACSALLALFQKNIPELAQNQSLADRSIRIGGVENTGNSCIFSVILQDFAALPEIYDPLLFSPLQQGKEEPMSRFALRQAMQQGLLRCTQHIRSGKRVEVTEVGSLAQQLQELGWQGHLSSAWLYFLNRLAPNLFPLPQFDVYALYGKVLECLLEQAPSIPLKIMLTAKQDSCPFSDFFASHPQFSKMESPTLWRVSLNTSPLSWEEQFQIEDWEFSLKVVHAYQMTAYGKHVVVYRKNDEKWICCNDTQITPAAHSNTDNVYTVVYESRRL